MRFEILLVDLKGIIADFRPQDLGGAVFWGLWIMALCASLRGVDRRDEIAQVTYMGALMALGVTLILELPFKMKTSYGAVGKIVIFSILLLLPSLRWMFFRRASALDQAMSRAAASSQQSTGKGK
jgi:hypothetical protein